MSYIHKSFYSSSSCYIVGKKTSAVFDWLWTVFLQINGQLGNLLKGCNGIVVLFVESLDKTRNLYYYFEVWNIYKQKRWSINGIVMNCVENRSLEVNYRICKVFAFASMFCCKHNKQCFALNSSDCKVLGKNCNVCPSNGLYKLLNTGMIAGPAIVFCRYHKIEC